MNKTCISVVNQSKRSDQILGNNKNVFIIQIQTNSTFYLFTETSKKSEIGIFFIVLRQQKMSAKPNHIN